jgi:hypothetical protein
MKPARAKSAAVVAGVVVAAAMVAGVVAAAAAVTAAVAAVVAVAAAVIVATAVDAIATKRFLENAHRGRGFQPTLAGEGVKSALVSAKFSGCGSNTGWKPAPRLAFSAFFFV